MIRAKISSVCTLCYVQSLLSIRNYKVCTKQKYGTALVLILETVSPKFEQKMKGDLQRQIDFIKDKMDLGPFDQVTIIEDVGSGLNDKRKGLVKMMKLAQEGLLSDLAIRYRDRLTRYGFTICKLSLKVTRSLFIF